MQYKRKIYRFILIMFLIVFSGQSAVFAAVLTGEDGLTYSFDDGQRKSGLDKIDPALRKAAESGGKVDVIIYLVRQAPRAGDADPVATIKAEYDANMDRMSDEIRTVLKRYRPAESLDEAGEKAYLRSIAGRAIAQSDQERIDTLKRQIDDERTVMHKAVSAAFVAAGQLERGVMRDYIHASGGTVHNEIALTNALGATIPAEMLYALADDDRVIQVLENRPVDYELDVSIPTAGFTTWHNAGIDGSGIFDFGVVDTGVQENHPNLVPAEGFFTNSVTHTDPDQEVGHGTHVTGIATSNHANIKGGAPNIGAVVWEHAGDQATTMSRMHNLVSDFVQSPEVVNHSLGYGTANVDDYNANDSFYDAYIANFAVMVSKSAGNNGWSVNPTITHPAPAYNLLAVANMDDQNTTNTGDDVRRGSSSVGPTVGNRRKPDITAPGSGITSTNFFFPGAGVLPYNACNGPAEPGADNVDNFCILSGTSMAAPHVAAGIILMEDGGNTAPRSQKAVMLNTADAWDSNDTSTTGDDGEQQTPTCTASDCETLWDRSYGWGYLDMAETNFNNTDFFNDSVIGRNDNATEDDYELYKGTMFASEKATLTWQKRADTYVDGGPAGGQRSIGDLNIRLYSNTANDLYDLDLTALDNVQQVVAPSTDIMIIKVYAWSTAFDGITSMPFTLATEENFSRVNPPSFSALPLIPIVGPFQTFTAPTQISNTGTSGAHLTNVAIGNIAGVIGDGTSQNIGTLLDGASEQVDFTLTTTGLSSGTKFIPVTVSSNSYDETYTGSFPTGVQFIVETAPPTSDCTITESATNQGVVSIPWTATDGIFGTGVDFAQLYVVTPGNVSYAFTGLQQNGAAGTFNYSMTSGDGSYRFAIRARDNGGNVEAVPASLECSIFKDTVDPQSTLSTPLFDAGGSIPLTWSVTDASPSSGLEFVDFWYYLEPAGPWTYTGLFSGVTNGAVGWVPPGPGVYRFFSRAKDNAQNIESGVFVLPGDSVTNFGNVDTDLDGVLDLLDNCQLVANADQRDTNSDNIGNACDPDVTNDCVVNFPDLAIYQTNFFLAGDLDTDNNGDGFTNFVDLAVIQSYFFSQPGPGAQGACN